MVMKHFLHKERITITIDPDIIENIEKEMFKHRIDNRSKFIEFSLRAMFTDHEKKYYLLQNQIEKQAKLLRALNAELLIEGDHIETEKRQRQIQEIKEMKNENV